MRQRMHVCDLAGELHVSSLDLILAAKDLGINVIRATALLTSGQEHRLREWHANGNIRRKRVQPVAERSTAPAGEAAHKRGKCDCCQYTFFYKPLEESHQFCPDCRGHFQEDGESYVRTLQRHEDHVKQARRKVEDYREAANRLSHERDGCLRQTE